MEDDQETASTALEETSSTSSPKAAAADEVASRAASLAASINTSNHVYIKSDEYAWIPARLLETNSDDGTATVSVPTYKNEQAIQSDGGRAAKGSVRQIVQLKDYPCHALLLQNVDEHGNLSEVEDMVDLPFLHEAAILYNLKSRHVKGKPYTRTGDIVIACNPYKWYNELYSETKRKQYAAALVWEQSQIGDPRSQLEPHVYESSSLAYRGLAVEGEDQSILVSGESGAGKTETVKILLSDLASVQRGLHGYSEKKNNSLNAAETEASPIVQRVLDSNPLLEAFGNAKTVRNDNSSRFGKFIQLQFDAEDPVAAAYAGKSVPSCVLAGSKCEVYLLEKSRVVSHEEEERTYHIFYQLLAAEEEVKTNFWKGLEATDNESFTYVGYTDTEVIEGKTDAQRFEQTLKSLALVGIKDDKLVTLMRAICIVLQIGNLIFAEDPTDESKSVIDSPDELNDLSELIGIPTNELLAALTIRSVSARNEVFKVPLDAVHAKDSCDAFAKEIYAKTFLWLVRAINDATCAELNYDGQKKSDYGLIGMLDIFGFETFEINRFEQLCINYANEKLQQKFTQDIFRSVQAEYEFEGIELEEIMYDDNTDVLDLVEGRMGLLAFLNEECLRPGGSDKGFVLKAKTMNKDNPCFFTENSYTDFEFGVNHYAGPVVYDATGFVNKNTDTLPSDLQDCAKKSSNAILANELENEAIMNELPSKQKKKPPRRLPPKASATKTSTPPKKKGSNIVGVTVWTKFKGQLSDLMTTLQKTRTRYIRCIKPNTRKQPLTMQHLSTIEQLRCAGVVAAVTISRSAFPNRVEHESILERFKSLWQKGEHLALMMELEEIDDIAAKNGKMVDRLLQPPLQPIQAERNGNIIKAYVIGKTRTYFRAGALEYLEAERVKRLGLWTVEIQKVVRKFVLRSVFVKLRTSTIIIQSLQRKRIARREFMKLRSASIVLECWFRCIKAVQILTCLRRNHMATLIQSHWRMAMAKSSFKKKRKAAILIQTMVRGAIQRPKFRVALHQRREEAKLENQVVALQRKLEEAEARRIEAEKRAEERARAAEEKARLAAEAFREQKEDASIALATAKNSEYARGAQSSKNAQDTKSTHDRSIPRSVIAKRDFDDDGSPSQSIREAQLSVQQQTLMDESGKMLEYLRKEVFRLRSHNVKLQNDFDLLKDNNQRLMDANASAGVSFAALNQHAKQLAKGKEKMALEFAALKQQLQKLHVTQVELKEELKMKQATYAAEVQSRLQYQRALASVVDTVQVRCRDTRLVEDVLGIADACEGDFMSGQSGLNSPKSQLDTQVKGQNTSKKTSTNESGLMSSIRSLWF